MLSADIAQQHSGEPMALSLRERKKVKARQALVEAAYRLFLKKGFDNTTADEIAQAAELSRSTFFRYFKTKEAVVFPHQSDRIRLLRELIVRHEEGRSPFEAVRKGLLDFARYFDSIREELAFQREIVAASPFLQARQIEFDREWERVIAERLLRDSKADKATERRARLVAAAAFGMVEAILREWFDTGCKQDLAKLGAQALDVLEAGVKETKFYGT
jgi:AcrR family transcriptional regulator